MKKEFTRVDELQVGDRIQGVGYVFEIIKHVLPFNEGDTFLVIFKNIETGEELTRYVDRNRRFPVLTY